MRGRGWLSIFRWAIQRRGPATLVSAFEWDTGVQVHAATDLVDAPPRHGRHADQATVQRDNGGKQFAGRVALQPVRTRRRRLGRARAVRRRARPPSSAGSADGPLGTSRRRPGAPTSSTPAGITSSAPRRSSAAWRLPVVRHADIRLTAARLVDARSRAATSCCPGCTRPPRWIASDSATSRAPLAHATWDAPVTRIEAGIGYSLRRNIC